MQKTKNYRIQNTICGCELRLLTISRFFLLLMFSDKLSDQIVYLFSVLFARNLIVFQFSWPTKNSVISIFLWNMVELLNHTRIDKRNAHIIFLGRNFSFSSAHTINISVLLVGLTAPYWLYLSCSPTGYFFNVWFFLDVFATTNTLLCRILDGSLCFFRCARFSNTHHCFCATGLCMLSRPSYLPSSWFRVRTLLQIRHTHSHNRTRHMSSHATTNKQQCSTHTVTRMHTRTQVDRLLIDVLKRAEHTRIHTRLHWRRTKRTHIQQRSIRWFVERGATNMRTRYAHLI